MFGLQGVFGLLSLGLAAGRLQAREKNPNWLDPTRGHRPRCGEDPIYWREFELPFRRGAGSLLVIRLRYVGILIRAVLINVLGLAVALLAVAVPIGVFVATMYYGLAAFRELGRVGYGAGPFDDRASFNMIIRAATGLLAFMPALGLGSLVAGRITSERDRKTWDDFLTTPLEGGEILRSKARAGLAGIWQGARSLPILWALGIASGVVGPLGVALAAVDLALIVWLNLALAFFLAIRPGTTSAANSRAATSMLVILLIHAPFLFAVLASPPELARFATWPDGRRWGIILGGLAIPILTAAVAWFLTRRTIARFDEWVGRPIAAEARA